MAAPRRISIRELHERTGTLVREAAAARHVVVVTDRGRPVAWLVPLPPDHLNGLIAAGLARAPRRRLADLAPALPRDPQRPTISEALASQRDDERF